MKKIIITIILLAAGFTLWHFGPELKKTAAPIIEKISQSDIAGKIQEIEKAVSAPPPLRKDSGEAGGTLTGSGVIIQTNLQRSQNGNLPALKENSRLNAAAQAKLKDIFDQQYFEHINPQGHGPAYLAGQAGYAYISIGENLALGNFKDDADLVNAWMNSPGHRANILDNKYEEIGVAVGQGIYEGHSTWVAVQEFGRPASSCPAVDQYLKSQILSNKADIDQIEPQLIQLKNEIDSSKPHSQAEYDAYNQKVAEYNALVKIYNNKVDELKIQTEQYNRQVQAYNACADG